MSPPKFSSLRSSKRRPSFTIPFRDDLGLFGLRYEKTAQAEPPILISAPKSPRRSTSITASSPATSFATSSSPPIAPPSEEHPALRSDFSSEVSREEWKRDSGANQSLSTTTTIYEEDLYTTVLYNKELELAADHSPVPPKVVEHVEPAEPKATDDHTSPANVKSIDSREHSSSTPQRHAPLPLASRTLLPQDSQQNRISVDQDAPPAVVSSRSMAKSLSFRGITANRLRKKSMVEMGSRDINSSILSWPGGETRSRKSGDDASRRQGLRQSCPDAATGGDDANKRPPHGPTASRQRPAANHGSRAAPGCDFSPISVSIPTDSLLGEDFLTNVNFSKRGSLMFGGIRAVPRETMAEQSGQLAADVVEKPPRAFPLVKSKRPDDRRECAEPKPVASTEPVKAADNEAVKEVSADTVKNVADDSEKDAANEAANDVANGAVKDATIETVKDAHNGAPKDAPNGAAKDPSTHSVHDTADSPNDATDVPPATLRSPTNTRVLSEDVERESQKVRSLYEVADIIDWRQGAPLPGERPSSTPGGPVEEGKHDTLARDSSFGRALAPERATTSKSADSTLQLPDQVRREYELAGGVEDWEDVDGADVDRYGFIRPRHLSPHLSPPTEASGRPTSRRRNLLSRRDPSDLNSARVPRKVSAKSLHTQASELSVLSMRSSIAAMRQAANLLPQNRSRRMADEAGEMLTHTPGLRHINEDEAADKMSEAVKRKEWERAEKWCKMAKVVKRGADGGGMEFEFDRKHPKLVDRTWKGIPDRWRAAAWYSFLATSAREREDAPSEQYLINEFRRLQHVSCEDDVQIDLDVPRTISQHIMFRRRYRGGQRLLFRVLHAVSLYYSDIGYVQGMASLGATLLCYFDEEKAFVMIVRMWQLRGLEQLYQHGFGGLMACLGDLEKRWLAGKDVAKKLGEHGIDATAFGPKWYLTLFNLSIPFPAQLRIWDVFLLLGDSPANPKPGAPPAGLDVLHAASAAIIDALSETILDSDFENTMKVLTSWVPIKDENLLMKVARAELKYTGRKKG